MNGRRYLFNIVADSALERFGGGMRNHVSLLDRIPYPLGSRTTVVATPPCWKDPAMAISTIAGMFDITRVFAFRLTFTSVSDLVRMVLTVSGGFAKVGELFVVGHGNSFGMMIGKDWVSADNANKHLPTLSKIKFADDGMITLGGCHVGRACGLLNALSGGLGVKVRAWTALQRPGAPGPEGSVVISVDGRISHVGPLKPLTERFDRFQVGPPGAPVPRVGM